MEIPNIGGKSNTSDASTINFVNRNILNLQKNFGDSNSTNSINSIKKEDQLTLEDLDKISKIIADRLEKLSQIFKGEARFEIDRDLDILIVKIVEKNTEKVIRQIPPEVSLKLAKALNDLEGILFDEKA
ncbi:flagellar protein FlaG [Petrotoga sp. 9PWA.NaAc.5.4]|uniref:flagellar protein FlaG n=1 Tax=Petrotoga sp. 9PWA.NaAc.5.4 TaxID=1434328 RepID=UPI000CC8EF14|nr:flagellar protein FlaG [Petrotoga sp. 9PWA.NaAc.5.4]PNR93984.1 flagellar protein FlaG [Petrotoga sp. 9PWA.NaAc.5.4]